MEKRTLETQADLTYAMEGRAIAVVLSKNFSPTVTHELLPKPVVLSGKDGGDAKAYQEELVAEALKIIEQLQREEDK